MRDGLGPRQLRVHALTGEALYGETLGAGALVDRWEIEGLVGRGGFASVYRARDVDGTPVAVKILHPLVARSIRNLRRFEREAAAIARLSDPRIVEVLGSGHLHDGRPFLVMEWLEGENLAARVGRLGAMSADEVVAIAGQVGRALAAAHEIGLIHRDVKPENVVVLEDGGDLRIKLVDFGIAKLLDERSDVTALTTAGVVGSPATMAPEQLRGGQVDARTDVYGLGVLLFFVATARLPFSSVDLGALEHMHLTAPAPRLSLHVAAPPWLEAAVQRCMAKNPADRFAGALELVEHLEAAASAPGPSQVTALRLQVLADGDELDDLIDAAVARLEQAGAAIALETGSGVCAFWGGAEPAVRRRAIAVGGALVGPATAVSVALATAAEHDPAAGLLALDGWPARPGRLDVSEGVAAGLERTAIEPEV